jgi:flagellar hook-associated protein 2
MVTSTNPLANAGSNIVAKLGSGSGIDSAALVNDLTEINRAPQAQRLESRTTKLETQISDFGLLRSSLSKFQTAASALASRDTFDAKAVAIPATSLLAITKLDAKSAAGDYRIKVEQIAQSHSLSSATFGSTTAPVGKGTLTIRLGDWSGEPPTFDVNNAKTGETIIIDDTNNSLEGLRDAINKADIGVQASIVSDGGNFKLLITGPSGAANELEITVDEAEDSPGLANFTFDGSTQSLTQEQEGKDALLRVNGLLVARESNRITDVIAGLEFDLFNFSASETVSINITADRGVAETAIRDFVAAYNTFLKEVEQLVGFNMETGESGSLQRDPLAKNLIQSVRSTLTSSVPGISNGFESLSAFGIRTQLDGSLRIVEDGTNTDFRAAMNGHFDKMADLFVPKTSASDSLIKVTASTARSVPGTYEVVITQQAEKGTFMGGPVAFADTPFATTDKDYTFTVAIDGVKASPISLPADKEYASGVEMAAEIQSLINLDPALKAARANVEVKYNSEDGRFEFTSGSYGSSSRVVFSALSDDMAELGIDIGSAVTGKDVVGTVDGAPAFGYGNVLLPALGSKAEGLSMIVTPGSVGGTITFSRGLAGRLDSLINDFSKSSGLIKEREASLSKDIEKVKDDTVALDRRTEAYRSRLQAQFSAMEMIVRSLNSTGSFLDGILDRLPFTAKSN